MCLDELPDAAAARAGLVSVALRLLLISVAFGLVTGVISGRGCRDAVGRQDQRVAPEALKLGDAADVGDVVAVVADAQPLAPGLVAVPGPAGRPR